MVTRILHYLVFAIGWVTGAYVTLILWLFGGFILFPDWRQPFSDAGTERFFQIWNGLEAYFLPAIMTAALLVSLWMVFRRRLVAAFGVLLLGTWAVFGVQQLVQAWLNVQPTG